MQTTLCSIGRSPNTAEVFFDIIVYDWDPDGKRGLDGFSAEGFFLPPKEVFLSFERCSTAIKPCAERI